MQHYCAQWRRRSPTRRPYKDAIPADAAASSVRPHVAHADHGPLVPQRLSYPFDRRPTFPPPPSEAAGGLVCR
jgi:hypothetical protein